MDSAVAQRFAGYSSQIRDQLYSSVIRIRCLSALVTPKEGVEGIPSVSPLLTISSGFLINVSNNLFICTAGHVLKSLVENTTGSRRCVCLEIEYGFHCEELQSVELEIDLSRIHYIDECGFDVGVMHLPRQCSVEIKKCGCVPWGIMQYKPPEDVDIFVILGFPKQTREEVLQFDENSLRLSLRQHYTILPIGPLADDSRSRGMIPRFSGKI